MRKKGFRAAAAALALMLTVGCGAPADTKSGASGGGAAAQAETTAAGETAASGKETAAAGETAVAGETAAAGKTAASGKETAAAGETAASGKETAAAGKTAAVGTETAAGETTAAGAKAAAKMTLAEKLEGKYVCPLEDGEYYTLDLKNAWGNLYAEGGNAMEYEDGEFPEPYSFWAMELIPSDPAALLSTEGTEAEVGILYFSVMSNLTRYWGQPDLASLALTEKGVTLSWPDREDEGKTRGGGSSLEFQRLPETASDAGIGRFFDQAMPKDVGGDIPGELFGLWREKDSDTPAFLEFRKGVEGMAGNRALFRVWQKKPGTEVLLGDGVFLCRDDGTMQTVFTCPESADMPLEWLRQYQLKGGDTLVFPVENEGGSPESFKGLFSEEADTVFERVTEEDVPLVCLASPDDVDAVLGEMKAEAGGKSRALIPQFLSAEQVENNGGNFLKIGELVYFRTAEGPFEGHDTVGGQFLGETLENSSLACYDPRTGETHTLFSDGGNGPLWYMDGRIWSTVPVLDQQGTLTGQKAVGVYPDGSGMKEIADAAFTAIAAVSDSARYFCVRQYGEEKLFVTDGSAYPAASYEAGDRESVFYTGFAGESLILGSYDTYGDQYKFTELQPGTEESIALGSFTGEGRSGAFPNVIQKLKEGDDVYLGLAWYEGTGHFLSGYTLVRVTPGKADSLSIAEDELPQGYGEAGTEPWASFDDSGKLVLSEHNPEGSAYRTEEDCGALVYSDSSRGTVELVPDFISRDPYSADGGETVKVLQTAEYVGGAVYVVTADAEREPEMDIGWRPVYGLRSLTWQRIPAEDGGSVETLAESK